MRSRFVTFAWPRLVLAPEGGGGGDGGGEPPAGGGDGDAWAGLDDATRQLVTEKGWTGPGDVVKAFGDLEAQAAARVAVPGADAKPEDWAAFWTKLGRPEGPDKYDLGDFQPPEGLAWSGEVQGAMLAEMHARGLNSTQVQGLLGTYAKLQQGQMQALEQAAEKLASTDRAALAEEWGDKFQAQLDLANTAVRAVFGEELAAAKSIRLDDGRFLLDDARLARVFATVGKLLAEDGDLADGGKDKAKVDPLKAMYPTMTR